MEPNQTRPSRRMIRAELLVRRQALTPDARREISSTIAARLQEEFPKLIAEVVGFYWPIRGEVDLVGFARDLSKNGGRLALPVIVGRREPLAFARWTPDTELVPGTWNIPVPSRCVWVRPTVLLIPVVGFDAAGYRIGYGGGYYDRTLAALSPRPFAIGIGHELGRLESIFPESHDVPLDAIVTEASAIRNLRATDV